jgi:hypothetical protein
MKKKCCCNGPASLHTDHIDTVNQIVNGLKLYVIPFSSARIWYYYLTCLKVIVSDGSYPETSLLFVLILDYKDHGIFRS